MSVLLACGHTANAAKDGQPVCVICYGLTDGAVTPVNAPELAERTARCADCGSERPSRLGLAFFQYRPDRDFDSFYCGCRGWD